MNLGVTAFLTARSMTPAELAVVADERGFHSLYLPEHTHIPLAEPVPPAVVEGVEADEYPRSLDPIVALATAAAVTDRSQLLDNAHLSLSVRRHR